MKFRRILAIGMAAVMMCAVPAYADDASEADGVKTPNGDPANTEKTDERLVIGISSEPSTLWGAPGGKTENESQIINSAIMDTLVTKDYNTGEVLPRLATDWEWVDDTHCRFTLRDDVVMTDGTPFVADDVVYTVNMWMECSSNSDTGRFMDSAEAEDEHTVTIGFKTQSPDLLEMLSWSNFGIASEDEVNAAGGYDAVQKNPVVGSGKYRFKEWKTGQSITLERNEDYWDPDYVGYFKEIVFTFTNDPTARKLAVESGDAQIAYDMPVAQAAVMTGSEAVTPYIYTYDQVLHLWYNMGESAGATKEQKVRQAIDKALNFDAMAAVGSGGLSQPCLGYFSSSNKYYNETYTAEERAEDIEGAKALLAEAGYENGLELTALGLQDTEPIYTVMQANLAQVGITLNLNIPDTPQFVQDAFGGNYDLIIVGEYSAARYPTMMCFLQYENVYGSGMVIGGPKWTTEEIDAQIQAAIQEPDEEKARELLAELENTYKEQVITSNLYPDMKASIVASDLKGFTTLERGFLNPTNFYR